MTKEQIQERIDQINMIMSYYHCYDNEELNKELDELNKLVKF